jgi:hypothetical protein
MLEILISFLLGSIFTSIIMMFYYKALDISYTLNTIKEDVNNVQVTVHHLFESTK